MASVKLKGYFSALCANHPLFQLLKNDNPAWWQFIKENIKPGGFYVDIRKDNSLNVYYNGGSLLKITLSRSKEISCKIHEYYLERTGAKYVNYNPNCLPESADAIKKKIASRYGDTSESGIKARLVCDPNAKYIDSEFAYPKANGMKKDKEGKDVAKYETIRIDLTKLQNGKIVFVELKRMQDGRLLTNEYENGEPEILDQMEKYHSFIKDHKSDITNYYKTLFSIKHDLGILPKSLGNINNIDDYELNEKVELFIEPYLELNPKRVRRIEAIRTIFNKNGIIHNL